MPLDATKQVNEPARLRIRIFTTPSLVVNASRYSLWKIGNEACNANFNEVGNMLILVDDKRVDFEPSPGLLFELIN